MLENQITKLQAQLNTVKAQIQQAQALGIVLPEKQQPEE